MASPPENVRTPTTVDALVQVSFAVQLALTRVATRYDLSVTQLRLLGILRDRTPSMAAIAGLLELDRSSVSGLVDRAERRGLVSRRTSQQDARVTFVEMTVRGYEVGAEIATAVTESIGALLAASSAVDKTAIEKLAESLADARNQR
jgi:MarR family transcriptional regulator, lower aerobic nicotinate degradation pathway regulator